MKSRTSFLAALALAAVILPASAALAVGNFADIQIFDRAENRTLPVYWHQGRAYVVGKPGNEYQVSVRNRAGADVLAIMSVDGVNVISGETAAPDQTGYVLGNGINYEIKGWRKNLSHTAAFYFTQLSDSYAARTGRPDNVGVIGVALFRRKAPPPPVAIAQPRERREAFNGAAESMRDDAAPGAPASQSSRGAGASSDGAADARSIPPQRLAEKLGTGHGRSETSVVRSVAFERATPAPEEIITLYYDSETNLVAMGVLPAPPLARPQPFPGRFVPDPPRG